MRKKYPPDFKDQAVQYALSHTHESLQTIANHLGIGYSTLDRWIRQASQTGTSKRPLSADQQRLIALEKEVQDLREVNDLLKKVHVYFLSNPSKKSTR